MRPLRPPEARVAAWTWRALSHVRAALRAGADVHTDAVRAPTPPRVRAALGLAEALRVADAVLTRRRATCLERTVVEQALCLRWGIERDVVIGVRGGRRAFEAHAWLAGDPDAGYVELTRRRVRLRR
ncbi:lasso peptide biosynthesis B2 protein [Patulibacter sp. SYSU D01012]|uniref:lasso peptide biosynthesis B2 protein n=1 Tax=Patulibacter sp. SYSU D01012 TaxID=2817381 RepID=UPI001B316404